MLNIFIFSINFHLKGISSLVIVILFYSLENVSTLCTCMQKNTAKLNKGYHVTITVYRILMYSVKLCFFLAFKNFTHASIIFVSFNEYVNKYIITCISWLLHDFSCNELHTPAHVIYAQHEMTLFVLLIVTGPENFRKVSKFS